MLKRLALSLILLFIFVVDASAVNHFWVGGGSSTNWSATAPTNWSLTSGGAGGATVPSAGDSVFFDASSGTGASVWDTTISLVTLDCTGSKNVVTHANSVNLTISSGNLVLPTGVGGSYTASGSGSAFVFSGTSGTQQITTNGGKPGLILFNGIGGTFQLQDNLAMLVNNAAVIQLTNGTFSTQTFTVNTPAFTSAGGTSKALVGSGAWTVGTANTTGTIWNGTPQLTISSFTADINIVGTAGARQFQGAAVSYANNRLIVAANSGGGTLLLISVTNLNNLLVSAPNAIQLSANLTLSNAPTITGSSGSEILFASNTFDTQRTISVASGTASFTWSAFRDIGGIGGATFTATNSFNLGDVSGITVTAPGSGGGACILGGWLLWRDFNPVNDNLPAVFDELIKQTG